LSLPVPYYERDGITIYCADCRDVLPHLPPVDLVLTDPPYNVGIAYGDGTDDGRIDYAGWCKEWFEQCRRMATRVAVTPGVANVGLWHQLEQPTWIMAWHKPAAMGRCTVGFNNWEPILLYGKPPSRPTSDVVVAPIIPDQSVEGHPCPKPLRWASKLIAVLSDNDGVILDPFMGSGTTLRAALDLNRKAIGIEIEERYCEIAVKRLQQSVMNLNTV